MARLNVVMLAGRLVADPEPKNVGDSIVTSFSLAVDRGFGKDKDKADFFRVECWNKTAEYAGEYLGKGDSVLVSGRLQQDTWEKDGKKQSFIKVVAGEIQRLSPKKESKEQMSFKQDFSDVPF